MNRAAFVGHSFCFLLWHLLTHCPLERLWHLLLYITMLGKVNARFLMYSDQSSSKIPVLESAFLCSLVDPTTRSVHHSCCADGGGSNQHHLHMGISSGSSESSVSRASEEFYCLVWDVALDRKAACATCLWLSCELHVPTVVLQPCSCSAALLAHVSRAAAQTHCCWQLLLHCLAGQKSSSWSVVL